MRNEKKTVEKKRLMSYIEKKYIEHDQSQKKFTDFMTNIKKYTDSMLNTENF